jgi:uncharacterized protein (TIGR03083 family)
MSDDPSTLLQMAEVEQAEFVELTGALSDDEWMAPSLCEGLSVRDVVVHVAAHIHHEPSLADIASVAPRARSFARMEQAVDAIVARRYAHRSPEELTAWLASPIVIGGRATAAGGLPGLTFLQRRYPESWIVRQALALDAQVQLCELLIHQQDVRRAVDRPRSIPAARASRVLDFTLNRVGSFAVNLARGRARGLRLVASDATPWARGEGPEVSGPLEALIMAVNGREVALRDLSGPGLPTLATRVGQWSAKFATT